MLFRSATNDKIAPSRETSTSAQVERLAKGADVIAHSNVHPVMRPGGGSGMPDTTYNRQSSTPDLAAMAQRAGVKHLILTHSAPVPGLRRHGPWQIPGGGVSEANYRNVAMQAGFTGNVIVGKDLVTLRLPQK